MPTAPLSRARVALAAFAGLVTGAFSPVPLHADETDYPYAGQSHCLVRGIIRRVDAATDHLTLVGDDDRVYLVDAYEADVTLLDATRNADTHDLVRGMRVRAAGTLVGSNLVEASTVRVISDAAPTPTRTPGSFESLPNGRSSLYGVVRSVDYDQGHLTVATADGVREVVDVLDAAITPADGRAGGQIVDLARGMRVQISGVRLTHARMVAEQVRVVPDGGDLLPAFPLSDASTTAFSPLATFVPASAPVAVPSLPLPPVRPAPGFVPPSPDPQFVLANLDSYTGILIDTRHLPNISRSPAPSIFGPEPGESLLYPDRSHVPTPDQVQDESVVRYYRTPAEARAGVCGSNPLILPAQVVLTPAQDSVGLSSSDMALFNALEQRLHFAQTWKVGFLVPGDK